MDAAIAVLAASLVLALVGAGWDIARRLIPNWLCLVMAVVSAASTYLAFGWSGLGTASIHAVVGLLVGMGLFAAKMIGGGDAKFYAAAAFGLPGSLVLPMLGWMSLSGLVLLIIVFFLGKRHRRNAEAGESRWKYAVPYGVAIAGGYIITRLSHMPSYDLLL